MVLPPLAFLGWLLRVAHNRAASLDDIDGDGGAGLVSDEKLLPPRP